MNAYKTRVHFDNTAKELRKIKVYENHIIAQKKLTAFFFYYYYVYVGRR